VEPEERHLNYSKVHSLNQSSTMRSCVLALFAVGASAFAPAQQVRYSKWCSIEISGPYGPFGTFLTPCRAPWSSQAQRVSLALNAEEMSKSIPFLVRPEKLDGSMAGDMGFDPMRL
jgi:hypothetical protein